MQPYITALNASKVEKRIDLKRMKTRLLCSDSIKTSREWTHLISSLVSQLLISMKQLNVLELLLISKKNGSQIDQIIVSTLDQILFAWMNLLVYLKLKRWKPLLFLVQLDHIIQEVLFQSDSIVTPKLLEHGQMDLEIKRLAETMHQLSRLAEKELKPITVIKFSGCFTTTLAK